LPDHSQRLEQIVQDFEEAWQAGKRPAIEEHLPADGSRGAVLVHLVHVELERRLKAGEPARVEDYLARFPELKDDPATAASLIAAEYRVRRRSESGLTADDYYRRFPQYAELLRQHWAAASGADPVRSETVLTSPGHPPPAGGPGPVLPAPSGSGGARYRAVRLHAKGGLGEVHLAEDAELNRQVALKRIQGCHQSDPGSVRRFLREAEVTARLEHPGVVPVHGLVHDEDGQPCYAMRFIEGESLQQAIAQLYVGGRPPAEQRLALRQLLNRFVTVCNTIAYAHSRGILHRDLKPHNVMLGKYGETLVVDWGLAKPVARTEADRTSGEETLRPSLLGDGENTRPGQAAGTPAYMSPEQAAGRWDVVGPLSDIYSLGATLYTLLTGQAAFSGRDSWEVLQKVQRGDFARPRQVRPEVPRPLEAICLKALALRPEDRYGTALELAADIECWLADEPVTAYREPVAVRAGRWMRRHKPAVAAAAAAVLVALLLGSAGLLWAQRQAEERKQEVEVALDQAVAMQRQARWPEARAVLAQAESRLGEGGPEDLARKLERARHDLDLVARLDAIRLKRATWVKDRLDTATADREYAVAFREAGLGEVGQDPEPVAARVRDSAVRGELVAALDTWACYLRPGKRLTWVLGVARRADPDSWRDRARAPQVWNYPRALVRLARGARVGKLPPRFVGVLGMRLQWLGGDGEALLRAAQVSLPGDFWVNFNLGNALLKKRQGGKAVGYYRAALAVRPGTSVVFKNLGSALYVQNKWAAAVREYRLALALDPKSAGLHNNIGSALDEQGKVGEAVREYQLAIALDPKYARPHYNLGNALYQQRKLAAAVKAYRRAIKLDPKDAWPHYKLGNTLYQQRKLAAAVKAYRRAIALDPKLPQARFNLGFALYKQRKLAAAVKAYHRAIALDPKLPQAHYYLGVALYQQRKVAAAVKAYRRAIALDPKNAKAQTNLGAILCDHLHDYDGAIDAFRRAIALDSKNAKARTNLGNVLAAQGRLAAAVLEYRRAIKLDPKLSRAHHNLGNALIKQRKLADAMREYRRAIKLDPKDAMAHRALGQALLHLGRFAEARRAAQRCQRCLRLLPAAHPQRQAVKRLLTLCEQLLALDRKLAAILKGDAKPDGPGEQLDLAILCLRFKQRYAAATAFYAAAFGAKPEFEADLPVSHRYHAARAAALAAAGKGSDASKLAIGKRARLRGQALKWLQADLALWGKRLTGGTPAARQAAQQALRRWQQDPDLAGVRHPAALARLPEAEWGPWLNLWADVDALLKRAEGTK
jgi:serine/threonine-protein kinase